VIPILIMPRVPPPASAAPGTAPQPQEIRLHRRKQAFVGEPPPVVPLIAPAPPAPKSAPPPIGPRVLALPSPESAVAANARNALRGVLGCANAKLVGLSREERQKCEDQLATGAKAADFPGLGLDAGKAAGLAAAGARRERDYRYMRSGTPVGVPTPPGERWDAQRSPPGGAANLPGGASAAAIGAGAGSDKPTLTVPF
jgi:hypothetical protein